ncbi:MAG TPA: MmcQ/YjbR family DNA-binding protein [Ramlibacter sp.]|uniref:MmcQ/YjbR family DNA-binding protein n=1 Tax=Ramlibacter sp. TaxID=1917967 RepID=UPI002B655C8E|nr:MmcQ/YjbR family DNA-binding protein [Ramlibacter sp.]HVZ42687.1 MmcQ/YjbR family DNA-binding protein [Ramlibacter sp.]
MPKSHDTVHAALKKFGLALPGAHSKSPWPEHDDLAVKDKTFAFMSVAGRPLHISCKLTVSRDEVLKMPFAKPTAYGLGKSGWVSMDFEGVDKPPAELLKRLLLESYRVVAPKKLVAQLEAEQPWTRMGVVR